MPQNMIVPHMFWMPFRGSAWHSTLGGDCDAGCWWVFGAPKTFAPAQKRDGRSANNRDSHLL